MHANRQYLRLTRDHHAAVMIALAVLAGLGIRLALLVRAGWRYDYDEGMVGLQALHILGGECPVFHPGQPYLGALESYLIAPLFAVFRANRVTLKIVPWLLSGAYAGSCGWLGWRAFDRRVGALSALLAAAAPLYLLITGMKTWGATAETLVLGNAALIAASYVLDRMQPERTRRRALVLGALIGGIAFWVSWLIAFYALPIAAVVVYRARAIVRRNIVWALIAFLAGSTPFWVYNIRHDWATVQYVLGDRGDTAGNVQAIIDHLNYDLAPRLVSGAPEWQILSWPAVWWLQIVYEGGLIGLLLWAWRGPWPDHKRSTRATLALFALSVLLLYIASGYGNHALNEFGFDATGRYVLMIHSALPVGVAAVAVTFAGKRDWTRFMAAGITTSVVALNLLGTLRANTDQAFTSPYYTRQPATLDPLIAFLDDHAIAHVWTDVGIAHVLMFETQERILAADWYDIYGAQGILRFPDVPIQIAQAERVAYIEVIRAGQHDTQAEQAFRAAGVPHTVYRVPPELLVIIPHEPLDPAVVADGLGYQF